MTITLDSESFGNPGGANETAVRGSGIGVRVVRAAPGRATLRRPSSERRPSARVVAPSRVAAAACTVRPAVHPMRLLWLSVVAGMLLGGLLLLASSPSSADSGTTPVTTTVVQVRPGETLQTIAERMAPGSDQAAVVQRIRRLNHLTSSALSAGQPLEVPDGTGPSHG